MLIRNEKTSALEKWIYAINDRDLDKVCGLYYPNAVLIPVLSDKIRQHPDEIREYFSRLFALDNLYAELLDCKVTRDNNNIIYTGNYTYSWTEEGEKQIIKARFSFVTGKYRILIHHSSSLPVL